MRISESRLRSIIRNVIRESYGDGDITPDSQHLRNKRVEDANMTYAQRRQQNAEPLLKHRASQDAYNARQDVYNREHQEAKDYFVSLGDYPDGNENLNGLKNHLRSVNLEWNVNWEDHVDGEIPGHVINDVIAELDAWLDLRSEFSEEDLSAIDGLVDVVYNACTGTCNSIDTNEGPQWVLNVDQFVNQLTDPGPRF